jgi:hypothetical protein
VHKKVNAFSYNSVSVLWQQNREDIYHNDLRDDLQALILNIIQDLIFNGPDLIEDVDDLQGKKKKTFFKLSSMYQ